MKLLRQIVGFKVGDKIALKSKQIAGYGTRPVGVIVEVKSDTYIVEITMDKNGDFTSWGRGTYVSDGVRYHERRHYAKVNIHRHFKKVSSEDLDEIY